MVRWRELAAVWLGGVEWRERYGWRAAVWLGEVRGLDKLMKCLV